MLALMIALLLFGLILLILESVVPGGIIGTIGTVLIVASGILFVREYGKGPGIAYLSVCTVLGFAFWLAGFYFIGKKLALSPPKPPENDEEQDFSMIGATGYVVAPLRPTGLIELGERRYNARSEITNIEIPVGYMVTVTGRDSTYLIVSPADSTSVPENK